MLVVCILAIIISLILLCRVNYQKHCIEDLETRISRMRKLQTSEILDLLYMLQDIQNEDYGKASKDTIMRNALNENIAKYSEQKRYLTNRGFTNLIKEGGKLYCENEYKKIELENDANQ